jgi:hypothetical protein
MKESKLRILYNSISENIPLNVFKPSPWFDENTSPVTFDNAKAKAKTTGIYMVYGQVSQGIKIMIILNLLIFVNAGISINK